MNKRLILGILGFLFTSLFLQGATIRGIVIDAESGQGVEDIAVSIKGTAFRTSTDRFGRYQLTRIEPGSLTVTVSGFNYATLSKTVEVAESGANLDFEISLDDTIYELETFTVNAVDSASMRALNKQRASDVRMDIIASDKFGKLPDVTIADSIRRLPGVTVEKDSQGRSGRYVTIRGMNSDFNSVNINGQKVVVSNFDGASRSVPLDIVASNSADTIEVTKAALPSDSADSIGGVINIRSASAFDNTENTYRIESTVSYIELADDYSGDYPHNETPIDFYARAGLYLNEARTLGNLASISYNRTPYLFESIENGPYVRDGGIYFPSYGRIEEAFDNVEILTFTDRLDYAPDETSTYSLELSYSERETQQGSFRSYVNYDPGYLVGDDPVVSGDTAVRFTSDDRALKEVRDYFEEQKNTNVVFKGEHLLDELKINYSLGYNKGEFAGDPEKDTRAIFRTSFFDTEYDNTSGTPDYGTRIHDEPDRFYEIFEVRRGTRAIDDETMSASLDVDYDTSWANVPTTISAGLSWTKVERDFDDIRRRYSTADVDWTLEEVRIGDDVIYGSVIADYTKNESLNGQAAPTFIDPAKVRQVEELLRQRGLQDEGDENWYLNQNVGRDSRSDLVNSYELEESIMAAYLMGKSIWEKWSLIYGVRVEATDVEVHTYGGDFYESDPDSELYVRPVTGENDYVNLFPHLHLRFDQTPDTSWRFSMNQTLARPSYRQLNPSEDIDPTANGGDGIVIKGNSRLDPVISTNIDLSVDHYFGNEASVTAGLFYKTMEDNVYRLRRSVQSGDPSYYPETAQVSEYLNADGAQVFGFEFNFYLPLKMLTDTLDGFILKGNYTYTDSSVDGIQREDVNGNIYVESGETPLFGQVSDSINLGLAYEAGGFEGSIDWHWTGAYLDFGGINADVNLDSYIGDRSNVDLNFAYFINEDWKVFFKAKNVFDDEITTYEGVEERLFYREATGRVFYLGFSWNP